jgi:type II secretion system protein C
MRTVLKLLLLSVLLYGSVALFYNRLEKRLQVTVTVPVVSPVVKKSDSAFAAPAPETLQKRSDYQIIVTRNIFKASLDEKAGAQLKEIDTEQLEQTALQLTLEGTVYGSDEGDTRAIITDEKEKKQNIYRIGESVQGAVIKGIERGKVILFANGRNEVLLLKDREGEGRDALSRSIRSSEQTLMNLPRQPVSPLRSRIPIVRPKRLLNFQKEVTEPTPMQAEPGMRGPEENGGPDMNGPDQTDMPIEDVPEENNE